MRIHFDEAVLHHDPQRRGLALEVMAAALQAVEPAAATRAVLRLEGSHLWVGKESRDLNEVDRILVLGAGKAGGPMSLALESILGDRIAAGLVVVKDDHEVPTARIELQSASHPVPDDRGAAAGARILDLARGASERDLVIVPLSGGGSALLTAPADGVSLENLQDMTELLLAAGATINEINCLRKHCSGIKGGQLARAAYPAACLTLALSDVIGSPLDVIASGPTVPDLSTWEEAWEIVDRFRLAGELPAPIRERLQAGLVGEIPDTPKPQDPIFQDSLSAVVADNRTAAEAALHKARDLGLNSQIVTTYLEGEAKEVAKVAVGLARELKAHANPAAAPACLILGGETTVTLSSGSGKGGRNQELALAAAFELDNEPDVLIAALATDGTDGPTDSAGALADAGTLERGRRQGLDPRRHFEEHNAYPFLLQVRDLLLTGPTHTNVNDLLLIFVWA